MKSLILLIILFLGVSCHNRYKKLYKEDYNLTPSESISILSGDNQQRWKIIERRVNGHYTHLGGCKLDYRAIFNVNGQYEPGVEAGKAFCGEALFLQNTAGMQVPDGKPFSYYFDQKEPFLYIKTDTMLAAYKVFKIVPDTMIIGSYSYAEWDPVKNKTNKMFVVETLIPEHIPNTTRYKHL